MWPHVGAIAAFRCVNTLEIRSYLWKNIQENSRELRKINHCLKSITDSVIRLYHLIQFQKLSRFNYMGDINKQQQKRKRLTMATLWNTCRDDWTDNLIFKHRKASSKTFAPWNAHNLNPTNCVKLFQIKFFRSHYIFVVWSFIHWRNFLWSIRNWKSHQLFRKQQYGD